MPARVLEPTRQKWVKEISAWSSENGLSDREGFRLLMQLGACAMGIPTGEKNEQGMPTTVREPEYMEAIKPYRKEAVRALPAIFAHLVETMSEAAFTDVLGPAWMEFGSSQRNGEFYTPQEISDAMAAMAFANLEGEGWPEDEPITLMEPACGAGGMILGAAKAVQGLGLSPNVLEVTAVDVDRTACDMCFLNMALHGIPGTVIHGNSITEEVWGSWRTPWRSFPAGKAPEDRWKKLRRFFDELEKEAQGETGAKVRPGVQEAASRGARNAGGGGDDKGGVRSGTEPAGADGVSRAAGTGDHGVLPSDASTGDAPARTEASDGPGARRDDRLDQGRLF